MRQLSKDKSLVNLANSILRYFGCETYHDSIKEIDELLEKSGKKKVCLMLFDGFGKHILEKHKKDAPFMYAHRFLEIESVFPPTTVAATTAVTTGKYPIETGYLGWTEKFKEYDDKYIQIFPSKNLLNKDETITPKITESTLKVAKITDDINKKYQKDVAEIIMSFHFGINGFGDFAAYRYKKYLLKKLKTNLFTYAYMVEPDHSMHECGTDSFKVRRKIRMVNRLVKEVTSKNKDTLFIAVSDHGMKDIEYLNINSIPGFVDTLKSDIISLEGRLSSFEVKDIEGFKKIYESTPILKDNFYIMSREEVMKNHIFGYSENIHPISEHALGDMFLFAHEKYILGDRATMDTHKFMKGHHAGVSDDEVEIFLQVYNND